jgi:NAD(P)-dependent dehydrogenase (short-subunit alcohol dehydrogenase family)
MNQMRDRSFSGSRVVVTGAATDMGFAIAEAFVAEGVRVLLADVDARASQAAADALGRGSTRK